MRLGSVRGSLVPEQMNEAVLPRRYALKRVVDILGATVALILFAVPMIVVAILVRVKLGKPIFFRQQRAGLHGRPFRMIKFRSMTDARGADGTLLPDADRLPAFGKFLRSSSLDELPELFNVLKGDMSLVGPRPLLLQYLERYSERQAHRHDVLPGLTGWAQINGRNRATWNERFELDIWYVENCSLLLDLKILVKTWAKVIARKDVSSEWHVTMPEFLGDE